jgi:uncharacterized protein (TIGR02284 family)
MLLRDDRQIALNQVETLCMEAADGYASATGKTADADLAQMFTELAREYGELAAELAEQIRALDDLPKPPDPDRETVEQVLTGIRAFFSGDARGTLLADREQCELEVEEAAREALGHALPPTAEALLRRILSHSAEARQRLQAINLAK